MLNGWSWKTIRVLGLKRRGCQGLGYHFKEVATGFVVSNTECHYRLEGHVALVAKPGIGQDRGQCKNIIHTPCANMESYSSPGSQRHITTLPQRPNGKLWGVAEMGGNKKTPTLTQNRLF